MQKPHSNKLEGMHCGACATAIQMYLSTSDGVSAAKVDYDKKEAEVEFDPSRTKVAGLLIITKSHTQPCNHLYSVGLRARTS